MNSGIYKIVINDMIYIGSTKNFEKRFSDHKRGLHKNKHANIILQRAFNKYGIDAVQFHIIEEIEYIKELILEKEQFYIDQYREKYKNKCCNISGASFGDILSNHPNRKNIIEKRSKTVREKISKMTPQERKDRWSHPGKKNGMYGKTHTKETREKLRNRKISKETREKLSNSAKARFQNNKNLRKILSYHASKRVGPKNSFYGKTHTEETRDKIRKANTGKKLSEDAKKAISGKNSGRYIGEYYTPWGVFSSSSAAEKSNPFMKSAAIHRICLNPDNIIQRIGNSKFLSNYGSSCIGRTYRELGFWFIPKSP